MGRVEKKIFRIDEGFEVSCGKRLAPIEIAYETCGELNADRSNAVLVLHALTGDSHCAGYYSGDDAKPGWWDIMIGPRKPIDTDKYFVICSNVLGGCMGSSGPSCGNPDTGRPYGLDFPVLTIGDMVRAQRRLVDHLGVDKLLCAVGGSVGGMQVLEWSVRYPDRVFSAVPLATTSKHSAQAIAFNEVARQAIMADPKWNRGDYYGGERPAQGLSVARMVGHITYLSDESMRHKFEADFQVESYLRYQGNKFVDRFDANSFLYLTKAADYFNLENNWGDGSLVAAFSRARARYLVASFTSDWLYPTYQSRQMVQAMKKNGLDVSFCEIEAPWGHDAFLLPNGRLDELMAGFLERMHTEYEREAVHAL